MNKSRPSKKTVERNSNKSNTLDNEESSNKEMIKNWHHDISLLSYEESIKALDNILENLQNDSVPVEELHQNYLLGSIHLQHCENLLKNVEEEVVELNIEDIK
tara:strand:+ start:1514 stop:1822 length:309 start_codon:yes stop_codon:yes gene_type:complete